MSSERSLIIESMTQAQEMSETSVSPPEQAVLYCTVHPTVETTLRCNKCGRPMCLKCAVRTPVGYRCKECVRGQQQVFFNANAADPFVQGAIGLLLGGVAAALAALITRSLGMGLGFIGWLIAFWAGSAVGAGIADVAHRAVRRRRSRYGWLVLAGSIAASGLLVSIILLSLSLTQAIFLVMAVSGAVGRLRWGR